MIEIAKRQSRERTMTIKPIPRRNCPSVLDFFTRGGAVEVPRPEECLYAKCLLKSPLRSNGGYLRQVVYWGLAFAVFIYRFRCRRCGKTISCPYSWLVPYRRFAAEMIAAGLENYADTQATYRDASTDLSDMDFADQSIDIRETEAYKRLAGEPEKKADYSMEQSTKNPVKTGARKILAGPKKRAGKNNESQRPVHTTVFYWVDFLCKESEKLLGQLQKEFVREWKRSNRELSLPAASAIENPNKDKACSSIKGSLLDQISLVSMAAKILFNRDIQQWERLRAYFLTKAESCKDILTNTIVVLTRTQTFELDHF